MKVYGILDPVHQHLAPLRANRFHTLCFEYEPKNFDVTADINEADIIPVVFVTDPAQNQDNIKFLKLNHVNERQVLALMHIYHSGDGDPEDSAERILPLYEAEGFNVVYITTDYRKTGKKTIVYDHYFNRQKAYFTDYDKFDLTNRMWTFNATKAMYELNKLKPKKLTKKFLIPNKTYENSFLTDAKYVSPDPTERQRFRKYLKSSILESDCYYSSPDNWIYLNSQEMSDAVVNDYHYYYGGMGFHPLANTYYETSAVSVYVESCVQTERNIKMITEKSYNPLIKGHFILPFSYQYYVRDLQELYGFRLPKWIDYSYDNIADNNERFLHFMKSFSKIRFKSLEELEELCNDDMFILYYNRNVFFEKPYDSLYDKLSTLINTLYRS